MKTGETHPYARVCTPNGGSSVQAIFEINRSQEYLVNRCVRLRLSRSLKLSHMGL